jgi:hypothetical protein
MRIAERILEAFTQRGLTPIREAWHDENNGGACGLTAVALLTNGKAPNSNEEAAEILGLPYPFILGFTMAWDGDNYHYQFTGVEAQHQYMEGRCEGYRALRLLRVAGYDI